MTHQALIIAHGSPADPAPQERWMQALAARVRMWLPGWEIHGTTLAAPGALEQAVGRMPRAQVLPFFMAEGWFTRRQLPGRLSAARWAGPGPLAAFGHHPALADLAAGIAQQAAVRHGLPDDATLVLAAHGSAVSRASATRTEELAEALRGLTRLRVITGYIEEAPFVRDVARLDGPALCLPLFATRAGHVAEDLPAALAEAGFRGPLLPAIGEHAEAARLIAQALQQP